MTPICTFRPIGRPQHSQDTIHGHQSNSQQTGNTSPDDPRRVSVDIAELEDDDLTWLMAPSDSIARPL